MNKIFTEENGVYKIDCSKAIWATDGMHDEYHAAGCLLSDADWILETDKRIYLVEYKNANIPGASAPDQFNPTTDKKINDVVKKFYDSLHYLVLLGRDKPREYIYILEYPNGDSVTRRMIRNRLRTKLPFALQRRIGNGTKLIEEVKVLSIEEWNADQCYGNFPICPVEEQKIGTAQRREPAINTDR